MSAPHRTDIKVRFYELDPYAHLNHTVYVAYFETARIELLETAGFGLGQLDRLGYRIVVSEIAVKFHHPVVQGDAVVVETGILKNGRASTEWHQKMIRGKEDLVAELHLRAAITDTTGKPTRIPHELREALEQYASGPG